MCSDLAVSLGLGVKPQALRSISTKLVELLGIQGSLRRAPSQETGPYWGGVGLMNPGPGPACNINCFWGSDRPLLPPLHLSSSPLLSYKTASAPACVMWVFSFAPDESSLLVFILKAKRKQRDFLGFLSVSGDFSPPCISLSIIPAPCAH